MFRARNGSRQTVLTRMAIPRMVVEALERRVLLDATTVSGPPTLPDSSLPKDLTVAGARMFFTADAGGFGRELWQTDGTPQGTSLVKDISPGAASSDLGQFTVVGNLLFFTRAIPVVTQNSSTYSYELWRSDGTANGTFALKSQSDQFGDLTSINGTLFFDAANGLWKSDGTLAGTGFLNSTGAEDLADVGGTALYFPTQGGEIWRSDGTPAGTAPVPGLVFGGAKLVPFGGAAYFDDNGAQLWKTDGTVAGTTSVMRLTTQGRNLVRAGNVLYFVPTGGGTNQLWRSDGTAGGTTLLKDFGPVGYVDQFTAAGDGAVFEYVNGTSYELWKTDGTVAGTQPLITGLPAPLNYPPVAIDGRVFFTTADQSGSNPITLWTSDETASGTVALKQFRSVPAPFYSQFADSPTSTGPVTFQQKLFLPADDGSTGVELWQSDGTVAGTVLFDDLAKGITTDDTVEDYGPAVPPGINQLATANGSLFFTLSHRIQSLWVTTPVSSSATELFAGHSDYSFGTYLSLTPIGKRVFFSELLLGAGGLEYIGATDGTPFGTTLLTPSPIASPFGIAILNLNGLAIFASGSSLWSSDGTAQGTVPLLTEESLNAAPVVSGSVAFFATTQGTTSVLWKTDGTPAGTVQVAPLGSNSHVVNSSATSPGSVSFIVYDSSTGTSTPWVSDGTAAGTHAGMPTAPGPVRYYAYDDGGHGLELWKTDSTTAGTTLVKDINPGSGGSNPQSFVTYNGRVYFSADDGVHGRELWTSDGTEQGTTLLADINSGPGSAINGQANPGPDAHLFTDARGLLYFNAYRPDVGNELWSTDGTATGTRLVQDLYPGAPSGNPQQITDVNGTLYFVASDALHRDALWKLPVGGPPGMTMDFNYLLTLAQHYNQPGTFATGDLNDDGRVNFDDLLILAQNYGHPLTASTDTSQLTTAIFVRRPPHLARHGSFVGTRATRLQR